ncbi:MAG: HAMP domain-containing histidine kinase [Chitinophagaceae bacterium]|nr:MAG: HAMP domain-containing histidine kinase [Chitinophagaceae bacterium]
MSAMIHEFLNLSRLEEGKAELDRSIFPLAELMEEVVGEASMLSPGYRFEVDCPHALHTDADRDKIGQVMTNLVNNAVKYSTAGTEVHISCRIVDGEVVIAVADQGIGISSDDKQRVFERFFRAGNDKTRYVSGFGIGLYLVSEILRLHGSSIGLESEPGKGSVFSFALPLYPGPDRDANLFS